jgi:hypothetical protein
MWPAKLYVPEGVSEIIDQLGMMVLRSPTFVDNTGRFPYRNIDVVFLQLNEALRRIRGKLGDERYLKLLDMADRMRAHFEADPEDKTDDSMKGRDLIEDMQNLLKQKAGKS